jgi:hypothetical protein
MWPQVVQFQTRQLQFERELQLARERRSTRASLEAARESTRAKSLRLRALPRRAGWTVRDAARSHPCG